MSRKKQIAELQDSIRTFEGRYPWVPIKEITYISIGTDGINDIFKAQYRKKYARNFTGVHMPYSKDGKEN